MVGPGGGERRGGGRLLVLLLFCIVSCSHTFRLLGDYVWFLHCHGTAVLWVVPLSAESLRLDHDKTILVVCSCISTAAPISIFFQMMGSSSLRVALSVIGIVIQYYLLGISIRMGIDIRCIHGQRIIIVLAYEPA